MTPADFLRHLGDPLADSPNAHNLLARAQARYDTYRRAYGAPSLEALARLCTLRHDHRLALIAACRDRDAGREVVRVEFPEGYEVGCVQQEIRT